MSADTPNAARRAAALEEIIPRPPRTLSNCERPFLELSRRNGKELYRMPSQAVIEPFRGGSLPRRDLSEKCMRAPATQCYL
jgi:hypothetical protein